MNPPTRLSTPKRFFILLAVLTGISAVYLVYTRSFGHLSRLVDYVGIFATFSTVMIITIFPPALSRIAWHATYRSNTGRGCGSRLR